MSDQAVPPGWYADPAGSGGLRWWDGGAWTPHLQPPPGSGPGGPAGPSGPGGPGIGAPGWAPVAYPPGRGLLLDEERAAGPAKTALIVGVIAYVVSVLSTALYSAWLLGDLLDALEEPSRSSSSFDAGLGMGSAVLSLVSNLASLAIIVVGILFLVWFYRAASTARTLGLPARLDPVWSVLGFIIPIVNLWFPYWVARDLFPQGAPERALAGRWWAWYLGASLGSIPMVVAAFVSLPLALVVALAVCGAWVQACRSARTLIDASVAVHGSIAGGGLGQMSPWAVRVPR